MGGYTPRAAVNPLDTDVYVDGAPASSWAGREVINNDRTLHSNIGQVICNEPILPLTIAGRQAANVVNDALSQSPIWRWRSSQGRTLVRWRVRLNLTLNETVRIHPLTRANPEMVSPYTQGVIGTGAEATAAGTVRIRPGQGEYFQLKFELVFPDGNDPAVTVSGPLAGPLPEPNRVRGAAGAFAAMAANPYSWYIRILEPQPAVGVDGMPLTLYHQVIAIENANTDAVIREPFFDRERPQGTIATVACQWEAFQVPTLTLYTIYAWEDVLTTEAQILGS